MASGETRLRQRHLRALRNEGWFAYAQPASPFTGPGRADLICCAEGLFVAIEVKLPGEQPRPAQVDFGMKVLNAGGLWLIGTDPVEVVHTIRTYLEYVHGDQ